MLEWHPVGCCWQESLKILSTDFLSSSGACAALQVLEFYVWWLWTQKRVFFCGGCNSNLDLSRSLYIMPLMASSSRLHPETMWWRKTTWENTRISMSEYRIWRIHACTLYRFCVTKWCQMHCASLRSDQLQSVNQNPCKLSSLVAGKPVHSMQCPETPSCILFGRHWSLIPQCCAVLRLTKQFSRHWLVTPSVKQRAPDASLTISFLKTFGVMMSTVLAVWQESQLSLTCRLCPEIGPGPL